MKSITLFLILHIASFTTMINLDDYSIDKFKNSMQSEGLFDLILSIKDAYGQDVAIISCEELNKNNCGNCKNLVINYMPDRKTNSTTFPRLNPTSFPRTNQTLFPRSDDKNINLKYFMMKLSRKIVINLRKLQMKNEIMNILKQNLTTEKSELLANNIVQKVDISKFLSLK